MYKPTETSATASSHTLAPVPLSVAQTGLDHALLTGLLLKHLYDGDVLTLHELAERMALRGRIIEDLLIDAKKAELVENRSATSSGQQRFALSGMGREQAKAQFAASGYLGAAPVPLSQYAKVCRAQSSRHQTVTRDDFERAMMDMVVPPGLKEKLGPALNSKRPLLIYGPAGTGKSFLCRSLNRMFQDEVLIPHAISVGHQIIGIFDPHYHRLADTDDASTLLSEQQDARWHRCQRPLLMVGGELTSQMLDISYDPNSRTFRAPIGLIANNGLLLIDDLGRQAVSPKAIFNRWILPLEEGRDFLALPSGEHFEVPFEQLLLFSTNLQPTELVDEAFLRRLGYKVRFGALDKETYLAIWKGNCAEFGLACEPAAEQWLVEEQYPQSQRPLLPCHPRDLLSIVSDRIKYHGQSAVITQEMLEYAWDLYFVEG
ncbi:AAA family ATPase [Marinobacter hydrocarbonoclasticus]|nr:AAA family ATPase [Marinobacter nauticus]